MPKLGWGVIGASGIADRRMIPEGILPARNARLVGLMTADSRKAEALGAKYGVPATDDVEDLLGDERVEVVYIASPNHLHKAHAVAAARAGKHVFCEKPLATNTRDARAIVNACRGAGVELGVGFMMRFNAYHQHIKKLIEKGALGTIVFARAQLTCWYPPMKGAWRQEPKCGGGGAITDLTVHCVDLLETLLGPAAEVTGFVERRVHSYESDDANALLLKFQSGAIGYVDTAFCIPDEASENVLEIQGSKGSVKARMTVGQGPGGEVQICATGSGRGYSAQQQRDKAGYQPLKLEKLQNTYRAQVETFSKAIQSGSPPPVGAEAGLHSMHVIEAAVRAAKSGRVQKISALQ